MIANLKPNFLIDDFDQSQNIIAAVSGGSDSLALLFLLQEFLQKHGQQHRLVAITIEHGLRPESFLEAQAVGALCLKHNIQHDIYVWQGEKPKVGISDKARTARYNLLCKAAKQYQSHVILTGHTFNDQIETFRMRQIRLDKGRGLAGMAREALLQQEFKLLRPLLDCKRADLRNYLLTKNIGWVDDPSNDNVHYERVRIRKSADPAIEDTIYNQLKTARLQREKAAKDIAQLIQQTNIHWRGEQLFIEIADDSLRQQLAFIHLIEVLSALVGGKAFLKPATSALIDFIATPANAKKATHCSALLENHPKEIRIWREQRNLQPMIITSGKTMIWDGRFAITNKQNEDLMIRIPSISEVHAALNELQNHNINKIKYHIPSLLTAPLIETKNDKTLPFISRKFSESNQYHITPVLMPFHWLASGHDFAMLSPLYRLFYQRMDLKFKIDGFANKNLAEIPTCTLASEE
ncbi:tRNA lysidine(34) synthetase TilS [Bartonella sp. HY329]|uniref:tRNA lysidine(34) synthetase TilS n=1 Tax=unclassified Bartonella TaxID=2645622 RepID=UPI0021CAA2A9|nr:MULTISPECIES: tRNA lysidine(34) synthetase TilS [unclassified Bartonella]UXM95639.1 tRNA lysidine(34) synthetase TilS [Bartonella sp. HY329]UXN09964.1 tRNA lysidine(34) synthetase TilS [Bartonella sp. HY328]